MPPKTWSAEELRQFAEGAIKNKCRADARQLILTKLFSAAQEGEFSVEISSEEMNELREAEYRSALIEILEEQRFEITESYDRDECFITIAWDKEK